MFSRHLLRFVATLCLLGAALACELHAAAPVIELAPHRRVTVVAGQTLTLSVTATGETALRYQWRRNGLPLPEADSATLELPAFDPFEAGLYSVEVTDAYGRTARAWTNVYTTGTQRRLVAWGSSTAGMLSVPANSGTLAAIATGPGHGLALRADGTVETWGGNWSAALAVPADLTDVVAISGGGGYSLALRADGTVRAWGDNTHGQAAVPAGLGDVVAISAGQEHALVLRADGTLVSWGRNIYGVHEIPARAINVAAIAAGSGFSAVLRTDGTLVTWGNWLGYTANSTLPTDVQAIAAGAWQLLSLRRDGTVDGRATSYGYGEQTPPSGLANVVALGTGYYHSFGLRADGTFATWGLNDNGQRTPPADLGRVIALDGGSLSSFAIEDTTPPTLPVILSEPRTQTGYLGNDVTLHARASGRFLSYQWFKNGQSLPGQIRSALTLRSLKSADAGDYHVVVTNPAGQTPSSTAVLSISAAPAGSRPLVELSSSQAATLTATPVGTPPFTYQWRKDGFVLPSVTGSELAIPAFAPADAGVYVAEATDATSAKSRDIWFVRGITQSSKVWAWGRNFNGQTTLPAGLAGIVQVAATDNTSYALARDGTVTGWGNSFNGGLPVPSDLGPVVTLSPGNTGVTALRADGTVRAWGGNPAPPDGLNEVVALANGPSHALALRADRSLVAWGENNYGQTTIPAGLSGNVVAVSAGNLFSVALKTDGTVVAWGLNNSGQTNVPAGLANVVALASGGQFTLALKTDGTVAAWGLNDLGQSTVPAGLSDVVAISAHGSTAHALRRDGTLVSWGNNDNGQTVTPAGVRDLIGVSAGYYHTLALRDASADSVPVFQSPPASLTALPGETATFGFTASGGLLSFQWYRDGRAIPGATATTLVLDNVQSWEGGAYHVVATNYLGSTASAVATLTISPGVSLDRTRVALRPGEALSLVATANGDGPLSYLWKKDGVPLPGATASTFARASMTVADSGAYMVEVTDGQGFVARRAAFVVVAPAASQIWAHGAPLRGPYTLPALTSDVVALANGANSYSAVSSGGVALKFDGTVVPFGDQAATAATALPVALSDIVAVSANSGRYLALRADGTVFAWGTNTYGESTVPPRLGGVVAVASGGAHSVALRADGRVFAWGLNTAGQCTVPAGLADIVAVAAGGSHTLALRADGQMFAWGQNSNGQCNVPNYLTQVRAIAAGVASSYALTADGRVFAWGLNSSGQINVPAGLSGVIAIAAGNTQALALKTDGTVATWGESTFASVAFPIGLDRVRALAGGYVRGYVLRDASADAAPAILEQPASVAVRIGSSHTFSPATTGVLRTYQWRKNGSNLSGQTAGTLTLSNIQPAAAGDYSLVVSNHLGSVTSANATLTVLPPPQITTPPPARVVLAPGGSTTLSVAATGDGPLTYRWKHEGRLLPGATGPDLVLSGITRAQAGAYVVEVIDAHGVISRAVSFVQVPRPATHLLAWGIDNAAITVPADLTNAQAVSAGAAHTLALRADGTVLAWGDNTYGQCNVPAGLADVVAISAGAYHSLALKADATVVAWGLNTSSQCTVPAGLGQIVAISAGETHSLALRADGTVTGWGTFSYYNPPAGLSGVVAISAGSFHSLALKADGTVAAWGTNSYGQTTIPAGLSGVVAIETGTTSSFALKSDGTFAAWGQVFGFPIITLPDGPFASLSAAGNQLLLVRPDGTLASTGAANLGTAALPTAPTGVFAASAGGGHSLALRDASADAAPLITTQPAALLVSSGRLARLSVAATGPMLTYQWHHDSQPLPGATHSELVIPAATAAHAGDYTVVVTNYLGSTTSAPATLSVRPAPTMTLAPPATLDLNPGDTLSLTVAATGAAPLTYVWRRDGILLPGGNTASYAGPGDSGLYVVEITDANGSRAHRATHVAVRHPAQIHGWGANTTGQLTIPSGLTDARAIAAASSHSLALRADRTVAAWGANGYGQTAVPSGLADVVALAAAGEHSLALRADGTVVAWGRNDHGQSTVPADLANIVAIATSGEHALALRRDGTVVAWGRNDYGQAYVPADLVDVVAIAANSVRSYALRANGTLTFWGLPDSVDAIVPPPPPALPADPSSIVAIAAGNYHQIALRADGSVIAWGNNDQGQISVPPALPPVARLAAGFDSSFALSATAAPYAWGRSTLATLPAGLGTTYALAAGTTHALALRDNRTDTAPNIRVFTGPAQTTVATGAPLAFSVEADGPLLSYQWYRGATVLAGQTGPTLSIAKAAAVDTGNYTVVVTNYLGSATSAAIAITVIAPPQLTTAPAARTMLSSSVTSFTLAAAATGHGPLTYAWKKNGRLLPGETASTLSRSSAGSADAGVYVVEIRDALGQVTRAISHVLHVTPGLRIAGWGLSSSGQLAPAATVTDPVAVAAGGDNSAALKADGTVAAWGYTGYSIPTVPASIGTTGGTPVVALSVGDQHALALRANGTVVAWGYNSSGRLSVPGTLTDAIAVSAGYDHSLALRANGTVVAWGTNTQGQCTIPAGLADVVAVSAGYQHSLALKTDGTVVAWGYNIFDQVTVPAGLSNVVAIAAGQYTSHALRADGTALTWGFGSDVTTTVGTALAFNAGDEIALALRADGTPVAWGSTAYQLTPVPAGATRVFSCDSGGYHVVVLRDASADTLSVPVVTPSSASLLAGQSVTFTVTHDATAGFCTYQWRKDSVALSGQTGPTLTLSNVQASASGAYSVVVANAAGSAASAEATLAVTPPPAVAPTTPVRQVLSIGQAFNLGVTATGAAPFTYRWKHEGRVIVGATGSSFTRPAFAETDAGAYVVEVTDANGLVGRTVFHLVPALTDRRLVGWGANNSGQLGSALPVVDDLWKIAAGGDHALALRANGLVYAWGVNTNNQTSVPASLSEVVAVAAGASHSVALKSDGTLAAWGSNNSGQTSLPSGANGLVGIAAGNSHSLALKADGTVLHWGRNSFSLPSGLTDVVALAAGYEHSLALRSDGTVVAWASFSAYGEATVPTDLRDVIAVAAGDYHSLALKADGTVVAWGRNNNGQTAVPPGLRGVVAISARSNHSLARLDDGTVVAWGLNTSGQATPPATLQNVREISAGGAFSLAVRDGSLDGSPVVIAPTAPLYVTLGAPARISVEAFGGDLAFVWTKDSAPYPAANGPTLVLASARAEDTGSYTVTATNASGSATGTVSIEVVAPPTVSLSGPARVVLAPGDALALSGSATGHGALSYRWFKDGFLLPGATSTSFTLPSVDVTHAGRYEVEATDAHGGGQSRAFTWVFVSPLQQQVVIWGNHSSIPPAGLGRVIQVAAGDGFTLALRADGSAVSWGPRSAILGPTPPDAMDLVSIAAGYNHCIALRADGTLVGWGSDSSGQATVPASGPFVSIAAAAYGSAALRTDGTVASWGRGLFGTSLIAPSTLRDAVALAVGSSHVLALRRDGSVVPWGQTSPSLINTPFPTWTNIRAIAAGDFASAGLRSDGTIVTTSSSPTSPPPEPIGAVNALVMNMRWGAPTVFARHADGTLGGWGLRGNLSSILNVRPTFRDVAVFAAGFEHAILVRDAAADLTPSFTAEPVSQRVAAGATVTFTAAADDAIYYRWYRNGTELIGNKDATLSVLADIGADEGDYTVRAVSGAGETSSSSFRIDFIENFSAWRARSFTAAEQSNLALSGPLAAAGSDGVPNLLKYALGVDARAPLGNPGELTADAGAWAFVYDRPSDRPDIAYEVETSTDLQTWTRLGVEHRRLAPPEGGWETWTARVPGVAPKRFYRLRVSQL
jgi:alpha-tubulin suppressor-like RCC1 family protein